MHDRSAAGHEVLLALADGEWHRLAEIAVPLAAMADPQLSAAIALGSIARFRDEGYEIEKDRDRYRLLTVPDDDQKVRMLTDIQETLPDRHAGGRRFESG
jgi:hypothetical protein